MYTKEKTLPIQKEHWDKERVEKRVRKKERKKKKERM